MNRYTHAGTDEFSFPSLAFQFSLDIIDDFVKHDEPFTVRNVFLAILAKHVPVNLRSGMKEEK